MIIIPEGRPRSGKTYDMAQHIIYDLSQGRLVHTNIKVIPDKMNEACIKLYATEFDPASLVFYPNIKDLWDNLTTVCPKGRRGENNKIYFDEFHKVASSRDWSINAKQMKKNFVFATEHGHFFVDLFLITQDANNIDAQFRRLNQYYWRYRALEHVSLPMAGKIFPFQATMKYIIDYDGHTKMGQEFIRRKQLIYDSYISESAQHEEAFMPMEGRGKVKVHKGRKKALALERILYTLVIIGGLVCGFLYLV